MSQEKVKGIEIFARPASLASPEVADAWIGVRIPFPPGANRNNPDKYFVDSETAVRQLAKKNPAAAEEIRRIYGKKSAEIHGSDADSLSIGLLWFSFERAVCKEVELEVDYT